MTLKTGRTIVELAQEVMSQANKADDFLAQSRNMRAVSTDTGTQLVLPDTRPLVMNDLAHNQVATHLAIPMPYYNRLRSEFPSLLDDNINTLLEARPAQERRLVRAVGPTARAVLSDRYRRLDNFDLMESILPDLVSAPDLTVVSSEITEKRLYIKVTSPRIVAEVKKGDTVQAGFVLSNSEVGLGAVSVLPFTVRLVCVNGMVHDDFGTRKHHVGRILGDGSGDGDQVQKLFADETLQADDKAFWMKVRDVVRSSLNEVTFRQVVAQMREASEAPLTGDVVKTVELLAKKHDFTKDEQGSVLKHLIEGADLSLWGLANAVTRTAADVDSYDRSTELEAIGGRVITLSKSEYQVLNSAA